PTFVARQVPVTVTVMFAGPYGGPHELAANVPDIVAPLIFPSMVRLRSPWTTRWIAAPVTVPLMVTCRTHVLPVTSPVPVMSLPFWTMVIVPAPTASPLSLNHWPAQDPVTPRLQ